MLDRNLRIYFLYHFEKQTAVHTYILSTLATLHAAGRYRNTEAGVPIMSEMVNIPILRPAFFSAPGLTYKTFTYPEALFLSI